MPAFAGITGPDWGLGGKRLPISTLAGTAFVPCRSRGRPQGPIHPIRNRSIFMTHIVSAVFDSHAEAERAVTELRNAGVSDNALSIIARRDSGSGDYGDANTEEAKEKGEGLLKGA